MINLSIKLDTVDDIKEFISITNTLNCEIDLIKGRYIVDGKSVMGVFTLNTFEPLELHIHSNDYSLVELFDKWKI